MRRVPGPAGESSWQARARARMREEIAEWVAEGRVEPQPDRPLVLLGVEGVVCSLAVTGPGSEDVQSEESAAGAFQIPEHMPNLVRHLTEVADVCWSTIADEQALAELVRRLGIDPLPCVGTDDYGTDAAARAMVWKAASAGRATYWIEHLAGEVSPRLPHTTVIVDTTAEGVLKPERLPPELRAE